MSITKITLPPGYYDRDSIKARVIKGYKAYDVDWFNNLGYEARGAVKTQRLGTILKYWATRSANFLAKYIEAIHDREPEWRGI